MSIPQRSKLLYSLRQWKTKAIARREYIEALKKRMGELTQSRDAWKGQAQAHHGRVVDLQTEVAGLRADVVEFQTEVANLRAQVVALQTKNRQLAHPVDAGEKKHARPLSS